MDNQAATPSFSIVKKTLWVWAFTILGIRLLYELGRISFFREYNAVLTAALLIYVPVFILQKTKSELVLFEKSLIEFLRSLAIFTLTAVIILPLLEVGNHFFQKIVYHHHFIGGHYSGLAKVFLFQLVFVGIPEEIFYRGYIQTQFNKYWGRPYRFLGASWGKGLIYTSLLFALSHSLIQLQWWHFAIFFPSLVFGWLREKTGTITACALFHALANTYSTYWVAMNYR